MAGHRSQSLAGHPLSLVFTLSQWLDTIRVLFALSVNGMDITLSQWLDTTLDLSALSVNIFFDPANGRFSSA